MEGCSQKPKKLCGHQKPEEARADSYMGTSTSNLDVRSDTDFCSVLQNCYRMKVCCSESAGLQCVVTGEAGKEQANWGASVRGRPEGRHTFLMWPFPEPGVAAKFYHLVSHAECFRKTLGICEALFKSTGRPGAGNLRCDFCLCVRNCRP